MIKAVVEAIYSKRDGYGNCYWAMRWTDTATSKTAEGTVSGGESNIACILRRRGLEWDQVRWVMSETPIRQFKSLTKNWPYAGCTPDELSAFIDKATA